MYVLIALFGDSSKPLFILCALVILSFYGGGFATIPAYLKDLFGTYQVGAIHGRLLTAWSTAGVLGPLIVNWIADRQKDAGKHGSALYTLSFCHHDRAAGRRLRRQRTGPPRPPPSPPTTGKGRPVGGRARRPEGSRAVTTRRALLFALVWLWVGIPFIYGLYELTLKLKQLFTG